MIYFSIVRVARYCMVINLAVINHNLAVLKTGSWSLRSLMMYDRTGREFFHFWKCFSHN